MSFRQYPLLAVFVVLLLGSAAGQAHKLNVPSRQNASNGLNWAMQAIMALTGGNPVNSANESGSVAVTLGGDQEQGTITLQATGVMTSQVVITTNIGARTESRTINGQHPDGSWTDVNGTPHPMPLHNCWTDAAWFFPALSLLADYADPNLVFTDIGPEQHQGHSVEHIQVYRTEPGLGSYRAQLLMRLSTVDYYLDSQTAIPVAMAFATHADSDLNVIIPVEIDFSNYQAVNGILVPYQIVKNFNGTPMLQISISSASLNGPVNKN